MRLRRTFKKTHQKSINFFRGTKLNEGARERQGPADRLLPTRKATATPDRRATRSIRSATRLAIDLDPFRKANKYYIRNVSGSATRCNETDDLQRMSGVNKGDTQCKKSMHAAWASARRPDPCEATVRIIALTRITAGYLMSQDRTRRNHHRRRLDRHRGQGISKAQFTINEVGGITGATRAWTTR